MKGINYSLLQEAAPQISAGAALIEHEKSPG
jgi:hypothetical protein